MDDVSFMERAGGLAHLADDAHGVLDRQVAALRHEAFERPPGDVVVHHDEAVGQLVGGGDVRQARAAAFRERRPDALAGELGGDLLAYERAGIADAHELGRAARALREDAVHMVEVVQVHGMHDLLVVQVALHLRPRPAAGPVAAIPAARSSPRPETR